MSSVHLATGNLLLGRRHAAHLEIFGTRGSGAHDGGQGHGAVLHLPHPVILLLKHSGPEEETFRERSEGLLRSSPAHLLYRLRLSCASGVREASPQPET